ncbi:MAG: helix-turn-helix domain-containing protein [Planctomycetota bacterium]
MTADEGYVIERERVDRLLSLFSRALAIRVTYFDRGDAELPLFDIADRSPYCTRLRRDAAMDARCVACDRGGLATARAARAPQVYRCHRDLWEAVVPLYDRAGHYLGALIGGQLRPTDSSLRHRDAILHRAYRALPRMDAAQFGRIVDLLHFIGEEIIARNLIRHTRPDWAEQLEAWVDEHLHERIDLQRMARVARCSTSFLSHRFREHFGCPPGRWLVQRRLRRAKELLRAGASVQTVAARLGYCDPFHFSKAFKRHAGCAPSAFAAG